MMHLDLFSGIGGFTLAAQRAGFETVGFAEIEPYCCALLYQHWPHIPNYEDIRTADFSHLRGYITVLSAGVPCQPASLAGKRRGSKDERWLWPAVLDVVGCVQPAWCLFENPPGILTLDEFGGILLRLESLGYALRAFSVPANAVGAKHRRERVFIVAHADDGDLRKRGHGWGEALGAWTLHESARPGSNTETLADADSAQWRQAQSRGNEHHGEETGWGQGADRFAGVRDPQWRSFRLTEPSLCGRVDGISHRSHRLKALGNAVVPAQCFPFFEAIYQLENEMEDSGAWVGD
jgi:DNA (cytosine-5)-methyltransferase 1